MTSRSTDPLRPRGWQLRRDVRFGATLAVRALGVTLLSGIAGMVVWTVLPIVAGYRPNVVTSDSMAPAIESGDVVLTRHIEREDVRPGQVVLVDDPSRPHPLLHRVRRVEGTDIVTQGDANPTADTAPTGGVRVLGVGRILVPAVGRPMLFLTAHPETVLLLAGFALVIVGLQIGIGRSADGPGSRRRERASVVDGLAKVDGGVLVELGPDDPVVRPGVGHAP